MRLDAVLLEVLENAGNEAFRLWLQTVREETRTVRNLRHDSVEH